MKAILFLVLFITYSISANAERINWSISDRDISIYAQNFKIESHEVSMECKLGDSDNLFGVKYLSKVVSSKLSLATDFAGKGYLYKLELEASSLSGYGLYKNFTSCLLILTIDSDQMVNLNEVALVVIKDKALLKKSTLPEHVSLKYYANSEQILIEP